MQDLVKVTGMVLKAEPAGEYDKRIVILTKEKGKITCFVKGARRQGNRFMAATDPFCFGEFRLYPGRTAYNMSEARISNYFEAMRTDFEAACYGMYFLELMNYYTRENNDEKEMLKLLYQSVKALLKDNIPNELVRYIFEIKAIVLEGEYPGIEDNNKKIGDYNDSTVYAVNYIVDSGIEKLYTFMVTDNVLKELEEISGRLVYRTIDREFKSLEILNALR